jgi:dihydropteroate synthase
MRQPQDLRLGRRTFPPGAAAVMAIVNRTPDSFYDAGRTFGADAALRAVDDAVRDGADIVDIGGVKAGPGAEVSEAEEIRRTAPFVRAVRQRHPDLVISVDTWRAPVARALCEEGADLINDTWQGYDPRVREVAAEHDVGLVCAHAGGSAPRTPPYRVAYDDLLADILDTVEGLAAAAVAAGVDPSRVIIDPAHDFAKNTWHSLEVTRRLSELTATGWPTLVAVSNKDFIGETLGVGVDGRREGTLAALAVAAWQGARVFRVHDVAAARAALDMVGSILGHRLPSRVVRGLE